jgi:hypothetical protein
MVVQEKINEIKLIKLGKLPNWVWFIISKFLKYYLRSCV